MKKLSRKEIILVGVTLFSMFFGAGNLIFPPYMANQAGDQVIWAFLGFAVSAVGLPVLGVIAVIREGGLSVLAGRVHPVFAGVYIVLLYLSIGPCLAIPRTASTSFEMAVLPFYGEHTAVLRLLYSAVFFLMAMVIAQRPEKLTKYLGKRLTPCLLLLLFLLFAASVFSGFGSVGAASAEYASHGAVRGFLDGYQTMDTLAGLNFGLIIALNIRAMGAEDENVVVGSTMKAGVVAGIFLLAVYGALTYVGYRTSGAEAVFSNGAQTLTYVVSEVFGRPGLLLLALIFVIACLNTCIGLLCCCGEFFYEKWPRLSRRGWILLFGAVSFVVSNAGLDLILQYSVPILNALYPVAIVLILLSCLNFWHKNGRFVYPMTAGVCTVVSVLCVFLDHGIRIPVLSEIVSRIPFYSSGFGWLLPSVTAFLVSMAVSSGKFKKNKKI